MFQTFMLALTALCNAYAEHLKFQRETYKETKLEALEDEKFNMLNRGDGVDKLRLPLIQERINRITESVSPP